MKRWVPMLLVVAGCNAQPPTLRGDTYLPPYSDVGKRQLGLTLGDGPNGAHIIFLNFEGQSIKPPVNYGDNPDTGETWIADAPVAVAAFDAAPYAGAFTRDQAKNAITNYFRQFYAPFNVQIVTTRPTTGRYTMCLIGDTPEHVLGSSDAAGIAPLDCGNDQEDNITFAFSASTTPHSTGLSLTQTLKAIAATAGQETAHAFGLSHTDNTADIMYPQLTPDQTEFVDQSMTLIENPNGACNGATTQNSKQLLGSLIGLGNGGGTVAVPTVKFTEPQEGATVPLNFTIIVDAKPVAGSTLTKVNVEAGPEQIATWTQAPYRSALRVRDGGDAELVATAFDANGNFQSASVRFKLQVGAPPQNLPPCTLDVECEFGYQCEMGKCIKPSSTGGTTGSTTGSTTGGMMSGGTSGGMGGAGITGGPCTDSSECASGVCADANGTKYCTAMCDPGDANSCPGWLACRPLGTDYWCQPKSSGSGGCSAAPDSGASTGGGLVLLGLALLGLAWRGRRAS